MDSEERARAIVAAAERLLRDSMPACPAPAPVGLCEDIHGALMAAYNILGKAYDKFDNGVARADIRNQRARLKRLANQLESQHMRPRGQRFKQRGDD
jgi:hypothetical protein